MDRMHPDVRARYRVLQQEADFALWRAREGNHEMRSRLQAALRNEGPAPADPELQELRRLEADAEAKYRELRDFLRAEFERVPVA
ncbi:hypothetical protein [Ramlibacter albus]|uniref:Uncharacterized protein n=1 Tax=Ramlibacter albus TaxID=2079448 RepID=A0A923MAN9_9BURK|nr:hypothetical protein [Ramlibacter albus]MBC5765854.1 hypothetical protein [Ramlibacter albus]